MVQIGLEQNGAMSAALGDVFIKLLNNDEKRKDLGIRGKALIEENRGATACTINRLKAVLKT